MSPTARRTPTARTKTETPRVAAKSAAAVAAPTTETVPPAEAAGSPHTGRSLMDHVRDLIKPPSS
ncbi:MAG TPA: hypothetical protein VF337_04585, partial [Candidatus Limnocylindrales bacterium]